jgi:CDGSH-type Zn-finger protein/uncharacterized Fe-S cluster protein YjdI
MALRPKQFSGTKVDVHWDGRLCIHVEECVRARGDLFVVGRKPWATPDVVDVDEVVSTCLRCPTGALTFTRGEAAETAAAENTVVVANNGPLYVTGELQIDGAGENMDGVAFRAALCRCGQSRKKPFCDGSHTKSDFRDSGAVGNPDPGNENRGGPLQVGRSENGPLLLSGNFRIVTGNGRTAWSGKKAALCRCGHSKNKPFCDGSHRDAGFEAE